MKELPIMMFFHIRYAGESPNAPPHKFIGKDGTPAAETYHAIQQAGTGEQPEIAKITFPTEQEFFGDACAAEVVLCE